MSHQAVINYLADGSWRTSNEIAAQTGVSPTQMRELCQEHMGSYISGQLGYKRADRATDREISASIGDLIGRASAILERAAVLERRRSYMHPVAAKKVAA